MEIHPKKATESGRTPAAGYNAGKLASSDVSMKLGSRSTDSAPSLPQDAGAGLQLLITLDPWYRGFLDNCCELFAAPASPPLSLSSSDASFWPDVFVRSRLPWRRFAESAILHSLSVLALWGIGRLAPPRLYRATPVAFSSADVLRYELSEYLPTLDTGIQDNAPAEKGSPAKAPQAIVSVPPNSENQRQTIVAPPALELKQDTPLPNIVAWAQSDPRIPPEATAARVSELRQAGLPSSAVAPPPEVVRNGIVPAPVLSQAVIAPVPEITSTLRTSDAPTAPQAAIVAPPPSIEMSSVDRWHDINIGRTQVISPAPQLPVEAQRALPAMAQASLNSTTTVVPPPPGEAGTPISSQHGRLIALNVLPAAPGPVEVPNGNRRGTFAVDPEGKANGAGTPNIPEQRTTVAPTKAFASASGQRLAGVPSGLFVGQHAKPELPSTIPGETASAGSGSTDGGLMAKASVPRVTATELSADQQTEEERQVFGGRRSYAMTLNVPNLNSAGGSWVMHFSEREDGEPKGDLVAPLATRTVSPKYPLELMRENVAGTVLLSAVISSDGHVGQVTVLSGTNDLLNEYARNALLGWRFMPALRNGKPVALQAVVKIPFRPIAKAGF